MLNQRFEGRQSLPKFLEQIDFVLAYLLLLIYNLGFSSFFSLFVSWVLTITTRGLFSRTPCWDVASYHPSYTWHDKKKHKRGCSINYRIVFPSKNASLCYTTLEITPHSSRACHMPTLQASHSSNQRTDT